MKAAVNPCAAPHTAVSDVLSSLAQELERMRTLGMRIELSLCQLAASASGEGAWLEDVQQFDLLLQQMAALRDFAAAAARAEGAAGLLDVEAALAQVTLQDVRLRLGGAPERAQDNDGFTLFDGDGA